MADPYRRARFDEITKSYGAVSVVVPEKDRFWQSSVAVRQTHRWCYRSVRVIFDGVDSPDWLLLFRCEMLGLSSKGVDSVETSVLEVNARRYWRCGSFG